MMMNKHECRTEVTATATLNSTDGVKYWSRLVQFCVEQHVQWLSYAVYLNK